MAAARTVSLLPRRKVEMDAVGDRCLDTLFRTARTFSGFLDQPVAPDALNAAYDLMKWAPTTANSAPGRFVFVKSPEAKRRLAPALSAGNRDKTMLAPLTVIVAHDLEFCRIE